MKSPAQCTNCSHLPHPDRRCRVTRIDGPASTQGHRVGDGYEHTGRTETQCECDTYQPQLNGVDPMSDNQIRDFVFLDTETLGLHPDAPIWEFAAIRRDGTNGTEYTTAITIMHDPGDWLEDLADQFLDDYGNRYIAEEAWCERAAASAIDAATAGAIIIGCNPGFDIERLAKLLRRNGIEPSWHYHPIDSASVAIGYLSALGKLPYNNLWKSDVLSARIGVDPAKYDRHTALGDVWWIIAQIDRMSASHA